MTFLRNNNGSFVHSNYFYCNLMNTIIIMTRIAQSERNISPIASVEGVAIEKRTSVILNEFDAILNILENLHSSLKTGYPPVIQCRHVRF